MQEHIFYIFLSEGKFNWGIFSFIGIAAFTIFCIHRIVKYFDEIKREQKLTRLELSKLADEFEKIRKQTKDEKVDNS